MLDPSITKGFRAMTPATMEDAINLNRRMDAVEQVLPTLATKADLERFATKADLERFATKADLEEFATQANLRFATKADLLATSGALAERIDALKRHTDVQVEDVRDDIRQVAEGVAAVTTALQANTRVLEGVVERLDRHETILETLVKRDI